MSDYNAMELMICVAARLLEGRFDCRCGDRSPLCCGNARSKNERPQSAYNIRGRRGRPAITLDADFRG